MKAKYIKAVEAKDLEGTRLFLANELLLDPRGGSFTEMRVLAEKEFPNIYEPDNGKSYPTDTALYNEDLLFEIKNDLNSNFSKEKLEKLEDVTKVVLKDKAEQLDIEDADKLFPDSNEEMKKNTVSPAVCKGTLVGGAALTVIGLCTSKVVLTSLGVVGLIIGGGLLYTANKKK
ncbi:MAG: hypothetical protein HDS42_00255 [Bacteroides sp.]|nr:hypothetical protein [Bacteroides sp.]